MEIIYLNKEIDFKDDISLCLGYFDGVHKGHLSLINKALRSKYKSSILTFDNLSKHNYVLTSLDDRLKIFENLNLDYVFVLTFNDEIKNLTREEFMNHYILRLNPKEIIVGEDYTFGKNKMGDNNYLKTFHNFRLIISEDYTYYRKKISTSYIMSLIQNGKIKIANKLLSRPYKIKGKVVEGLHNGHKINYPTLNLKLNDNYLLPKIGVYKGYVLYKGEKYLSMINVGTHPTIAQLDSNLVEAHIINKNIDLYNEDIDIEFISFLRGEIKFASLQELENQLDYDKNRIINNEI